MNKIKKLMITLVALLAVTTGAWALDPNAVTAAEINSDLYSGWTSLDEKLLKASDLPGFQAVTENQAKSWTGVPSTGRVKLFYDFVADGHFKVVIFKNGVYDSSYEEEDLRCYDIYEDIVYDGDTKYFYTTGPAPAAASGPEVAWNGETKTGTFKMPGGNVTLEPEYYPQATLAFQGLTAAEDAAAKTEAPLAVLAENAVYGGTLMYYVAPDENFSQADAIALAETQWSADIPTAETIDAAGTCYVWYYIKGDAEHSDTDPKPLAVTVLPEPTYAVTFAEGTDPNEWTADPNADVKKGQTVTVTYTGSKKVIGVKAEKKKAAPAETTVTLTTGEIGDLSSWGSNSKTINGITIAVSGDAQFHSTGLMDVHGDAGPNPDPDQVYAVGTFTFTSSAGKIKRIDINLNGGLWYGAGEGWPSSYNVYDTSTFTWSGTPAASVTLNGSHKGFEDCSLFDVSSIVFTIEPTN